MKIDEIIKKVKEGLKNFDTHNVNHSEWEDFKLFHYYRDLLLDNDFINNTQVQKIYFELFKSFEILDYKLNSILKDILSKDEQTRINASIELEKIPRREVNMVDKIWLKDPRCHAILTKALDDDNDVVVKNLIKCFNNLYSRGNNYSYDNLPTWEKIISKYEKADNDLKIMITKACFKQNNKYLDDKHWLRVCEILDFKPKKKLYDNIGDSIRWAVQDKIIPENYKSIIKDKIWNDFETIRGKFVKWKCLRTYLEVCSDDISELKRIRNNYSDEALGNYCKSFLNEKLELK